MGQDSSKSDRVIREEDPASVAWRMKRPVTVAGRMENPAATTSRVQTLSTSTVVTGVNNPNPITEVRHTPRQSLSAARQQTSQGHTFQTQITMERQRNASRYTTGQHLQNTVNPASMYPDLTKMNTATSQRVASPAALTTPAPPAQKTAPTTTRERHLNCHSGGANGSCARKETEAFVFVNNYVQQQFQTPTPSAPPEHPPFESSNLRPARPPPPRDNLIVKPVIKLESPSTLAGPSKPSQPPQPPPPPQNTGRSRSASRVRSPDNRFNCPTCGLLLGLTIFSCDRGHSSCKECKLANRLCGQRIRPGELCRTPIGNIRNISVEAMVADHLVLQKSVCPNAGCTLSYNMADMAQHQRACPFGETDCPMGTVFGQCHHRYKVDAMASHFDAFHREQRIADFGKEMFIFNICMESQRMFLLKNGPYNFLVHVKVAEEKRNVYMTVQMYSTAVSASKWTYEFHVYNKSQPRRKFTFVDQCHSVATSVDDIFKEAKCATLPLNFAMTFVNDSVLTYKFFIKKTEINKQKGRRNNWKRQNTRQD